MTRGSLRLRLLLAAALSVLVALALSAFGLTLLFERHVERRVDAELGVFLDQIVAGLDRAADGSLVLTQAPADPRFEEPLSGLYWQLRAGDAVLASRSLWDATLALPPDELPDRAVHRHRIAGPGGAELIVLERSVTLPERLGGGILRATPRGVRVLKQAPPFVRHFKRPRPRVAPFHDLQQSAFPHAVHVPADR